MIFFILSIILSCLSYGFYKKKILCFSAVALTASFIVLNLNLPDHLAYNNMYKEMPPLSINIILGNDMLFNGLYGEYLYKISESFFKLIGVNFFSFSYLIIVFLVVSKLYIFHYFTNNNKQFSLSVLFYFIMLFPTESYIFRQSIASSLLCFSIVFLMRSNYFKSFFSIFLSGFFHISAYLGYLLLPLKFISPPIKWYYICIFIIFILGILGLGNVLDLIAHSFPLGNVHDKLIYYIGNKYSDSVGIIRGSVFLYTFLLIISLHHTKNINKESILVHNIALVSLFFLVGFNDFGIIAERMFRLFSMTMPIIFSWVFYDFFIKNSRKYDC